MDITLYVNKSSPNTLSKILDDSLIVTGDFNTSVDILNPFLRINSRQDILDKNYLYIPKLKRYYYIQNIVNYRTNIYDIYCYVDVLMSWKDNIKTCYGVFNEGEDSNPYINGYITSHDVRKSKQVYNFENNFTDGTFVLVGIKGVRSE